MGALFLELKATQMPFNNKMAKYIVMFVYNGILHSNGKWMNCSYTQSYSSVSQTYFKNINFVCEKNHRRKIYTVLFLLCKILKIDKAGV